MAKLHAISDLHLRHDQNRAVLEGLADHGDDWLIVAGDVGERDEELEFAWSVLTPKFARLLWVPGNHELWTVPGAQHAHRGDARYRHLVELCRRHGVVTPEDPYPTWRGEGGPCVLAPLFLLYDYSFRPDDVAEDQAIPWAAESGVLCADEHYLHPDPYPTRKSWCAARVEHTERRLRTETAGQRVVLINHFPLRYDLVRIRKIPRFSIWCGTRRTEDWHTRFDAVVAVAGHLHVPRTSWRDGVRFEDVSLGYPRERKKPKPPDAYLREILPGPKAPVRS